MLPLRIILILFFSLSVYSCKRNSSIIQKIDDNSTAGYINNSTIPLPDIDKTVQQELYDELYRIYIIRKTALTEYFMEYMLQAEAQKHKLSKEQYLENYIQKNTNDKSLALFIQQHHINIVPELKRTLKYYNPTSKEGKVLLQKSYRDFLINKLVDSLKAIYKPAIAIQPPLPPEINLDNIYAHYRGNLKSTVTLLEVSDLECGKCREYFPVYEKIERKYHNKIRFGFTHFSSYVTLSALATECAAKQGKFWEMRDSIFHRKLLPDTADIFVLAKHLHLNINQFQSDFYNTEIPQNLNYNFKLLKAYGLYATPTILINGKPVFDSSSLEAIENQIESELLYQSN